MPKQDFKGFLLMHIARIERKIDELEKVSSQISRWRLGVFLGGILYSYFTINALNSFLYTLLLLTFIIGFIVLIDRHLKVEKVLEKFKYLKQIKEEHVARFDLDWQRIPQKHLSNEHTKHPFGADLNIFGKQSLIQLLDTSIYEGGLSRLSNWLLDVDPDKERILERQKLVQELSELQSFRDRLRVEALYTKVKSSEKKWTMEQMLEWLRLPKKTGFILPLLITITLSVSNITLGILALTGQLSSAYFVLSFVSYLTALKLTSEKVKGLFDAAFQMEKLLGSFSNILSHVELFKVNDDKEISRFLRVYQEEKEKPSIILKNVRRFAVAASIQKDQLLGPVVNLFIPWNLYFSMRLENLKEELEPKLTRWLDKFYELEALNSLANFSFLNPEYSYPDFQNKSKFLFEATDLAHPLIKKEQKVANDFVVKSNQNLFLITGSNMAGKSTFLRTVGINLVLAYAGAPVNAKSLNTGLFRIFTSINVNDSLGDGLSHFYAEVKRLKQLIDELNKEDRLPLFFFVDEIYKGTNNRERFAGSAAFLREIAGKNGIGMVSTHDLELADLESEINQLTNWHFSESISNDKMSFEYKLKPGPCPSTNALKIMKIEGLPIE